MVSATEHLAGDVRAVHIAYDDLLALALDYPVDRPSDRQGPLAAPAPSLDPQFLAPVRELEESARSQEE